MAADSLVAWTTRLPGIAREDPRGSARVASAYRLH
jgi:hypothetical protein